MHHFIETVLELPVFCSFYKRNLKILCMHSASSEHIKSSLAIFLRINKQVKTGGPVITGYEDSNHGGVEDK